MVIRNVAAGASRVTRAGTYSIKFFLIAGLGALAWISTYTGMLELIQANLGQLDIVFKVAIGGSVAMLMLMIIWLLDQMFNENNHWVARMLYVGGYLFLALISIGFSFGFYWKFLESRSEGTRVAESAVTQVQSSLHIASTRLEQLVGTLGSLQTISLQKAEAERVKGDSCPNSKPGDGPRRRLRESDAATFSTASDFVKGRVEAIKGDVASLDSDLAKIVSQDKSTFDASGTRNEFMKALGRKLEITVSGFNAFRTDPQLQQFRADFAERADKTQFPDEQGKTFNCPDVQLSAALKGAVKAIDALPDVQKPEINTVEGADATIEAFRRLTTTLMSLAQFKLPVSPDDIRELQAKAVQSAAASAGAAKLTEATAGLGKRDYIPLAIAVFVDVCLLLVKIPVGTSPAEKTRRRRDRLNGDSLKSLESNWAIHHDPDSARLLGALRHVAFSRWSDDYVAVPLVATKEGLTPAGATRRLSFVPFLTRDDEDSAAPPAETALGEDDLKEAQSLANFFATNEKDGFWRRLPVATFSINKKLTKIRSKWAALDSFRLYKFKKGAYSDFMLDLTIGADKQLEPVREAINEQRVERVTQKRDAIRFESEVQKEEHLAKIADMQHEADIRKLKREHDMHLDKLRVETEQTKLRQSIVDARREAERIELDAARVEEEIGLESDARPGVRREREGFATVKNIFDALTGKRNRRVEPTFAAVRTRRSAPAGVRDGSAVEEDPSAGSSDDVDQLKQTVSELAIMVKELAEQNRERRRAVEDALAAPYRQDAPVSSHTRSRPSHSGTTANPRTATVHGFRNGHGGSHAWNGNAAEDLEAMAQGSRPYHGVSPQERVAAEPPMAAGSHAAPEPDEPAPVIVLHASAAQNAAADSGQRSWGRTGLPPSLRPLAEALQRGEQPSEPMEPAIPLPRFGNDRPAANDEAELAPTPDARTLAQPSSLEEVEAFIEEARTQPAAAEPMTWPVRGDSRIEPTLPFIPAPAEVGDVEIVAEGEIVAGQPGDAFEMEDVSERDRAAWEAAGPEWQANQDDTLGGAGEDADGELEFATEQVHFDPVSISQRFAPQRGKRIRR